MKAWVDPQVCIGCTLCTQICPEVFRMEQDKAVAYREPFSDTLKQACQNAAEQCPVSAITIER